MGPLEFMVIGFEGNRFTGEIMPQLNALREQGLLRVLDLLFVQRDAAGEVTSFELSDLPQALNLPANIEPADWFSLDDVEAVGDSLENQSSVAMVLIEHLWAVPLQEAILRANGVILAEAIVPREVVAEVEALVHARAA